MQYPNVRDLLSEIHNKVLEPNAMITVDQIPIDKLEVTPAILEQADYVLGKSLYIKQMHLASPDNSVHPSTDLVVDAYLTHLGV